MQYLIQNVDKYIRVNWYRYHNMAISSRMAKKKIETRGGRRAGSGRKSPFTEKTTGVKFMPPVSKVAELKAIVARHFKKWAREGV